MSEKSKLSVRDWFSVILFGLFGQLAWVVENMYFNVFLYKTISQNTSAIATMVAASAAVATLTTMFMGALSDKVGRRKLFITVGYLMWGLSTLSFAFISIDNVAALIPAASAVTVAVMAVIVMDCVMTFFGSTANDGAFNAWVTDITNADNRGKVEGVLAVLPLAALLIIFGAFDGLTQNGQWPLFFYILGGLISLGGIIGLFLIKESKVVKPEGNYWETFFYGFKPKTLQSNKALYLSLTVMAVSGIAYQVFMPYFIVYFTEYLGISNYVILLASVLVGASIVTVIVSKFINAKTLNRFFIPSLAVMIVGLLGLFFIAKKEWALWIGVAGLVMMAGNLIFSSIISAKIRNLTPVDKAGHFQGIRMIFYVLLPMIIGPFIGDLVIKGSSTYTNEFGEIVNVPTPYIFLAAALVSVLAIIPLLFLWKQEKNGLAEAAKK